MSYVFTGTAVSPVLATFAQAREGDFQLHEFEGIAANVETLDRAWEGEMILRGLPSFSHYYPLSRAGA